MPETVSTAVGLGDGEGLVRVIGFTGDRGDQGKRWNLESKSESWLTAIGGANRRRSTIAVWRKGRSLPGSGMLQTSLFRSGSRSPLDRDRLSASFLRFRIAAPLARRAGRQSRP
ncbi:hypothetical protein H6G52_15490 [Limnothrix sp. FACHB-881]|uniref:hypothetical protein n=1 Tax=Limnothrix sp. FACHB-881 TaxID=2692819 RepID=UPI0016851A28|nr:hypothetical protein [Limnothrix sp. FACHB-881]MBD2636769.1 hypothetical protein [Limnothrix sp. FACHB-881]